MEAAAEDLLAALSSPSSRAGLRSRFSAYLQPFSPHLPGANPNPTNPPPKRTTKQPKQQPLPPPDAAAVRPLAKRFLPFLCRALHLLPPLLRPNPSSVDADELLEIYGLVLDCLAAISTCLAGKPYSVLLQRGHFVCCLESRGHYARAQAEAAATLDALRHALSPTPTAAKPRRGAASAAPLLPEPGVAGEAGADPEISTLAIELTVCLANCASKGKVKEAAPYERVLVLVEQIRPWLRILTEESSRKYLTLFVNALSRCAIFLAAESSFFNANLVRKFCVATLEECEKEQMMDRLPTVARKICSSVDLSWVGSMQLLHDVLKTAIESVLRVKVELPKAVNELLEFVAYFSRSFHSSNKDLQVNASELLYIQGGYLSEISPPMASVLHLYATGLHFSLQQIESEGHPAISVDFPKNEKNLQTLSSALGTLARIFCVTDGKSSQRDSLGKYASPLSDAGHPNMKHSCNYSESHEYIYFVAYFDSLEFVCKILLQHANAVWKNFSEGKTVPNSRNMTCIFMALDQFIDFSLIAYSCTKRSEEENDE